MITLPATLLAFQLISVADFPSLNVDPTCNAAGEVGVIVGRTKEACVNDENEARDQLRTHWAEYPSGDKGWCIGSTRGGGVASYVELLTCLEMAKQARDLPDETVGRGTPRR